MRPYLMLLYEPNTHPATESLCWLDDFLKGYDGALLMTSPDREFMTRTVTKIIYFDACSLNSYTGDYGFYEEQRRLNEKNQQAQFERQQAMLAKEIKFIERFKARASHASQVQSRVKKLEKRSEEHTSELQSLMRISYAVFCLKKKKTKHRLYNIIQHL